MYAKEQENMVGLKLREQTHKYAGAVTVKEGSITIGMILSHAEPRKRHFWYYEYLGTSQSI